MKKLMKKLIAMATALVMIVTLLPAVGVKAGSVPTGSITIEKTTQDATNPLEGAGFSVYCMLTFFERNTNNDGRNNMQWTVDQVGLASQFSEITVTQGMNVNDLDMSQFTTEIAKTVEGNPTQYQKYQLGHEQLTQIQDGSNKATTTFNVPYGIYLVVETTVPDSDGVHTYTQCEPFFVSIPMTETEEDENGDVIYSDPRVLSLFELMRVMSLPDDWPLPSNVNVAFVRSVIGEGIPPLFVKKVFEKII